MTAVTLELQVTSFHPGPTGGGIVIGRWIGCEGHSAKARLEGGLAHRQPSTGESWRITGSYVDDPVHGRQIAATVAMPLCPQGEGIIRWISSNPAIPGVGDRTARRLWEAKDERLYAILRDRDVAAIAEVVGPTAAIDIVNAFADMDAEITVLEAYGRYGVDARTAMAASTLWGTDAVARLKDDPYAVNVVEAWRPVDERALRLGVSPSDPRRLRAAVAEACSRRYTGRESGFGGNLANTREDIERGVETLLGGRWTHLAASAVDAAVDAGELVPVGDVFQSRGCHLMEREVERSLAARLARPRCISDAEKIEAAIDSVEGQLGRRLDQTQRDAVFAAVDNGASVVDGGAGTGKTTTILAIMRAAQSLGRPYAQMALSGRAAKRIFEATGHEAVTIARFLKELVNGRPRLTAGTIVIDEASMVGTPELWQILSWLSPDVDVVLVGDTGQLPPISPGRPFHTAVHGTLIPRTTLTRIYRQAGDSDIPSVAAAIRAGHLPELPDFDPSRPHRPGVFLVRTPSASTAEATLAAFEAVAGGPPTAQRDDLRRFHSAQVQLLGATMRGAAGVTALSEAVETRWMAAQPHVHDWGLAIGSKVLWTRNSYDRPISSDRPDERIDIMNGSLGVVQRLTPVGAIVLFDDAEGTRAEIFGSDLQVIRRGWAVTVHKSQGSAFRRVVMPVVQSRLLDRLLLYTGVTRATETVVMVGDEDELRRAVSAVPRSWRGRQTLEL